MRVNDHTLSDFRAEHGEALDELLTDSVAALLSVGAVKFKRMVQDGTRVRASAGASSFGRKASLERCLEAARERAIREREERIAPAVKRLPDLEQLKAKQGKKPEEARASTTDAEATVMKRRDGGFRPADHAQYATSTESQVIVGVAVVTVGSDMGQLAPMVEQVTARCERSPDQWLVDGGYPAHEPLDTVAEYTEVYAPVPKPKDEATDPHTPKPRDSAVVAVWRQRMGAEEAKALYKERAATAECINALARERGLTRLRVRGQAKVRGVLLLHALAHNLMHTFALAPELLGFGVVPSSGAVIAT